MTNTIDLETYTPERMIQEGWRRIGPRHWQRTIKEGHIENYFGEPRGRNTASRNDSSSGSVSTIVLTRRCWDTIQRVYGEWGGDGRECGAAMVATREGNEIFLHDTAEPYFDDVRYERAMEVKDGAGFAMEDARAHLGQVYGGFWHVHPPTSRALPSPEDELAFSLRERKELGGCFAALIMLENEDRSGFADVRGYVSQGGKMYPVVLEVEG